MCTVERTTQTIKTQALFLWIYIYIYVFTYSLKLLPSKYYQKDIIRKKKIKRKKSLKRMKYLFYVKKNYNERLSFFNLTWLESSRNRLNVFRWFTKLFYSIFFFTSSHVHMISKNKLFMRSMSVRRVTRFVFFGFSATMINGVNFHRRRK